jgi:methionyl-tRNA formyltransferase
MIKKMDAGDIIFTTKVSIEDNDSSDDIFDKLSIVASQNITN